MKWVLHLAPLALMLVVGAFLGHVLTPDPPPLYSTVTVTDTLIRQVERVDTVVSWRERIVYRRPPAETRATAPGGAVPDVSAFCADAVESALAAAAPDSTPAASPRSTSVSAPTLLLRSIREEPGWLPLTSTRLIATGPLSTGDLRQLTYRVHDGYQLHTMGDSLLVQSPRFWLVREGVRGLPWAALGFLVGQVLR